LSTLTPFIIIVITAKDNFNCWYLSTFSYSNWELPS